MARALIKEILAQNPILTADLAKIYSQDESFCVERYASLTKNLFGEIRFFSSPGRAELVGNHTDHNHGFVIASTIDLDIAAAVVKTDDGKITINSAGYPSFIVGTNITEPDSEIYFTSAALVQGVVKGFIDRGYKVGGFTANTHSNIFKGAGVSSSAAFELLICEILNTLYNGGKISFADKAIISQYAENVYFGKPSGLMDQLTISRGGVSFMDFNNPLNPKSEKSKWDFKDLNIVIINCGGDHCNLTGEYASIRKEMHEVAEIFGKSVLREVDREEFIKSLPSLQKKVSGRAILRSLHYFDENQRTLDALSALRNRDKLKFLDIINSSGDSSYKLLQNCYPALDKEQRIPFALAVCRNYKEVLASRVHGGGFAGTILAFVEKENLKEFETYIKNIFGEKNVFAVAIRQYGAIELGR